jgi:hypothetical protein
MEAFAIIGGLFLAGWALKKIGDRTLSRASEGDGNAAGMGVGGVGTDSVSGSDGGGHGGHGHGGDCGGHGGGGHGGW